MSELCARARACVREYVSVSVGPCVCVCARAQGCLSPTSTSSSSSDALSSQLRVTNTKARQGGEMEEKLQALSLLLLPLPLDWTFEHAATSQLSPYLGLDPPQPRPQGHTAGRKPTEERGAVGLSSFLPALINFIGRRLPTPTFSERTGASRPGAQLGRTKSCTLRHLWSTSTSEQHYTTRQGWSAGGRHLGWQLSHASAPPSQA